MFLFFNIATNKLHYFLLIIVVTFSHLSLAKAPVDIYIYVDKPPFVVDQADRVGLSYDFIDLLNDFSTKYSYRLVYLPKKRAMDKLANKGVLLWVIPEWVNDTGKNKYDWIDDLIFDKDLYLTNDPNLIYQDEKSLEGKVIVGVRGYSYPNLDTSFKTDKMSKVDVKNETLVPLMLIKNRVDVGIIGYQTYFNLKQESPEIAQQLFVLNSYQHEYFRGILFSKSQADVKQDVENWFNSTEGNTNWQLLKKKWLAD